MTLKPEKLPCQLPIAAPDDIDDRDGGIVVADPAGNSVEALECPTMSFQEGLGAFPRESLQEVGSRCGSVMTKSATFRS
jgi:hypothetical protein